MDVNKEHNQLLIELACDTYPYWEQIITGLHAGIEEIAPGYRIAQIKEKFLGLRFYYDLPDDTSNDVWEKTSDLAETAEVEAYKILSAM